MCIKYFDDEGDLCTLADATLQDAFFAAAESRVLRFKIVLPRSEEDSTPTPSSSASGLPSGGRVAGVAAHFARARPNLAEGLAYFQEQVKNDFQSAREDMQGAFDPAGPTARPGEQPQAVRSLGAVAATAVGVVVATRLLPVRATRLAAQSAAALASPSAGGAEGGAQAAEATPEAAVEATAEATPDAAPETAASPGSGHMDQQVAHFKDQVKQDFQTAHGEVKAAFRYVLGRSDEPPHASTSGAAPVEQRPAAAATAAATTAAATVAGLTVASTLAPLRALRLAVAGASTFAAGAAAAAP